MHHAATWTPYVACLAAVVLLAASVRAQTPLTAWLDGRRAALAQHRPLAASLPWLLLIYGAFHFYALAHLGLSVDDEGSAWRRDPSVWLAQGRFAVYWIERLLVTTPTMPFVPDALCGALLSVAYVLLVRLHVARFTGLHYLLFPLFCASPVLLILGEFYGNVTATGAGFALVAASLCLLQLTWRTRRLATTAAACAAHLLLLAGAVGCYQAFVLVYLSAAVGMLGYRALAGQTHLSPWQLLGRNVQIFGAGIAGVALYRLLQRLHLALLLPRADTGYIDNMWRFEKLLQRPGEVFTLLTNVAHDLYAGRAGTYGGTVPSFGWIGLLAAAALLLRRPATPRRVHAAAVLLLLQAVALPFALNVLVGGIMPVRCMVAVPYALWLMALLACTQWATALRLASKLACSVALLQLAVLGGQYAAEMDLAQKVDVRLAGDVYRALQHSRPDFTAELPVTVDIYGKAPERRALYPTAPTSTTGASFFGWDEGNPYRMLNFMNLLGYNNLTPLPHDQRAQYLAEFATMPSWPLPGCVRWHGNTALLKLGPVPGVFHRGP